MITPNSSLELSHFPVMLDEVIKSSSIKKGDSIIDCTFGGGSYSRKFLEFTNTKVIALDRDSFVLGLSKDVKEKNPGRFTFYQKKFSELDTIKTGKLVDIIVFDLGLSSIQLNNLARGFSFSSKESLDMSMGLNDISAEMVVNTFSENTLKLIIKILGEEKDASRIAKNIILSRTIKKITKVNQLVEIIEKSKTKKFGKINPSTKTFQALRIFVNKEITELIKGIVCATKLLKPGGRILVISFHSIEDKIVKYFFSNFSSNKSNPSRYFPEKSDKKKFTLFESYRNKIIKPSSREIVANPPSRSAKLRYAIRNKNKFFFPLELEEKFKKYLELEKLYA